MEDQQARANLRKTCSSCDRCSRLLLRVSGSMKRPSRSTLPRSTSWRSSGLLALDPLQEAVHRALMRLSVRDGRRERVDTLRRELSVEAGALRMLGEISAHRDGSDAIAAGDHHRRAIALTEGSVCAHSEPTAAGVWGRCGTQR
jgi:hypothetical protein